MTRPSPFDLIQAAGNQLAEALCPWCGDDYNRDRHPNAPPLNCPWCQRRARILRELPNLSRADRWKPSG